MSEELPENEEVAEQADAAAVLDQSDIDRLMQESGGTAEGAVFKPGGGRYDGEVNIVPYDFYSPSFLTESEMRQLRMKYENYCHYLAARLALFLKMDFKMSMSGLDAVSYKNFIEETSNPTHINIFSLDGFSGVGLLDMKPRMSMTIVNRMLGGKGHSIQDERALTEIESTLMDDFLKIVLDEWCNLWIDFRQFGSTLEGRETDARFLNVASQDTTLLVLKIDAQIGDCAEPISLAFPNYMMEPIIRNISEKAAKYAKIGVKEKHQSWRDSYSTINVPTVAEWNASKLSVRDILSLKRGDILEMPSDIIQSTQVRLMNTPCFEGEIGVDAGQVVVKINNKIKLED